MGRKALGSYIGGPDSEANHGSRLALEAASRLKERAQEMTDLPVQMQLSLLRLCFFPQLNHLLRTLTPGVSHAGAKAFDGEVTEILQSLLGSDVGHTDQQVAHLPVRMGGLGLTCQEELRFAACGASYLTSRRCGRSRPFIGALCFI